MKAWVPYLAEFIGTAILVLLGNGSVANVLLAKANGRNAGLLVILLGWSMAVFIAVFMTAPFSGAHLNPNVTIGLALAGKFAWSKVAGYVAAQMLGGMVGALAVWLTYRPHFLAETDPNVKLAVFCTSPAVRNVGHNVFVEAVSTFVLVLGILYLARPEIGLGALDALPVGFLMLGIGIALGGASMSAARDLSPRIVHALLPIPGKRDSDWNYAWIPVVGPLLGCLAAVGLHLWLHGAA